MSLAICTPFYDAVSFHLFFQQALLGVIQPLVLNGTQESNLLCSYPTQIAPLLSSLCILHASAARLSPSEPFLSAAKIAKPSSREQ